MEIVIGCVVFSHFKQNIRNIPQDTFRNWLMNCEADSCGAKESPWFRSNTLIWSMDIFEQVHHTVCFHMLQVIDLGSRRKLELTIKGGAFTGKEVRWPNISTT